MFAALASAPAEITKTYPTRGPLQQFRLAQAMPFACFRCGQERKSKLHTIYEGDWSRRLCNGCYGRLLSIYEVVAGTPSDAEAAAALTAILPNLVSQGEARSALRRREYAMAPEEHLGAPALQFLATGEFIAQQLVGARSFEWSPAVISLCKALEAEVVERLLVPLRNRRSEIDFTEDVDDKDFGRVARWCVGRTDTAPELGAISHLLQTAANSRRRAATSPLLLALSARIAGRPRAGWITDELSVELRDITSRFRNPAAHLEVLDEGHYRACHDRIASRRGVLWRLVESGL